MFKHNIVLVLGCSLALALAGCSRQQSDWQKTRETNTADAYEQFLKKYPTGEFTAQAQARAKELYEEREWQKARDADTPEAYQAFLKQYPEGKWTEEARIRVENFTLAQAPNPAAAAAPDAASTGGPALSGDAPAAAPVAAAKPKQSAPAASTSAAPSANLKSGPYGVQLGAFKSGAAAAKQRWDELQQEYPSLLTGLTSKVSAKKTGDGNLYRLQATGLSEKHARDVCGALKAKSEPCVVLPPANG